MGGGDTWTYRGVLRGRLIKRQKKKRKKRKSSKKGTRGMEGREKGAKGCDKGAIRAR